MFEYYYLTEEKVPIKVIGNKKPCEAAARPSWVVREWNTETMKWEMPIFPEVTLGTLRRFVYIGKVKLCEPIS